MEQSDQDLVDECLAGRREAFAVLVARYQTLVCSIAYGITGNFAASEDVGQDAFVAAWKQLSDLADKARFKPWLCAITRNLARNVIRREDTHSLCNHSEPMTDPDDSPVGRAERNEEETLVWSALSRLPENYREPLVLFYRQSQSVMAVADALDVTPEVVKQRLSRGRKLLRAEVMSSVERTLQATTPSRAFTMAVVAALPMVAAKTAVAATTGSATALAKSASGMGAAKASGLIGPLIGTFAGLGGAALGTWVSWSSAKYKSQRDFIRRQMILFLLGCSIFMLPFLAMYLGWQPQEKWGTGGYLAAYGIWMTVFFVANAIWIARGIQQTNAITKREQAAKVQELPSTPLRRWLAKWEGRRWRSRATLLGWPLIEIAFADPAETVTLEIARSQGTAQGWIAIGDRARGGLLAIGGKAVAPIAIGTFSCGVLSFGVISIGCVSIGVVSIAIFSMAILSVGGWSVGGAVAVGYLAAGPAAIGWEAAYGAVAVANQFADGAKAIAAHAGDETAKQYFAASAFFQWARAVMDYTVVVTRSPYWPLLFILAPVLFFGTIRLAYRRKRIDLPS